MAKVFTPENIDDIITDDGKVYMYFRRSLDLNRVRQLAWSIYSPLDTLIRAPKSHIHLKSGKSKSGKHTIFTEGLSEPEESPHTDNGSNKSPQSERDVTLNIKTLHPSR